jgi:4-amino-4-deoxy-L-arabinose transferase-like glycosyltransferase
VCLTFNLSGYPLLDPDEGRNSEVAREMSLTNDYVLPRLNAVPYLDKPVLYFAAGAAVMEVLGPTVTAARLPSLLFTLATIAVVAWFGLRLFGTSGAWTAGIATAATPFSVAYARTVIFDSTLTFFVVLALVAFYLAVESTEGGRAVGRKGGNLEGSTALPPYHPTARRGDDGSGGTWWTTIAWGAMAFGVLTKGPIALAIPLMVVVPFVIWRRAWRALADAVSVLLFLAILLPWLLAISRQIPDFLHYALVTETARRLTTDELNRTGPIWYFAVTFPAAALPWTLVAAAALPKLRRQRDKYDNLDGRVAYLALWIAIPLLFFSLSQSKRPQYVLPLVPAVALLVTAAWAGCRGRFPGARVAAIGLAVFGILLIAGAAVIPALVPASGTVAEAIPRTAIMLGCACLIGSVAAWIGAAHREVLLLSLSLPIASIPVASVRLMNAIGADRSAVEIARAIEVAAGKDPLVVGIEAFPLSLPFYLRNTVVLSTTDGSEITSNYFIGHFDDWAGRISTVQPVDWWRDRLVACTRPTVFVVSSDDADRRSTLGSSLNLLIETRKYSAYGPCGITNLAATD